MKMKLFKNALPWLALAVLLPVLALPLTAVPAGAGCCGGSPPETELFRMYVSPDGGGDVVVGERLPGDYPYVRLLEKGEDIYLEAIPADGYYFVGWSGDLSGDANPTEITLATETTITAEFFPEEITSEDNRMHILFREGTLVQDSNGTTLFATDLALDATSPPQPDGAEIIGPAYDLEPHGATFNWPATLTFSYDPGEIPAGVTEKDLVVGYYDDEADEWLMLRSSVDVSDHTLSSHFDHFSTFAVVAPLPPQPATFTTSDLTVSPTETGIGEAVTVSVLVTNAGEAEGSYSLDLTVNGAVVDSREITMAGGSQEVVFTTSGDEAGSYSVNINGLEGSFTVREALATSPGSSGSSGGVIWIILGLVAAALMVLAIIIIIFKLLRRHDRYDYYY